MLVCNQLSSLFGWILFLSLFSKGVTLSVCDARDLENSRWRVPSKSMRSLDLYIHRGLQYSPLRAFTDIILQLNLTDTDTYDLYKGDNCSVVEEAFQLDNRIFGLLKGVDPWKNHRLNVFNDTVVGISTLLPYSVEAKVINVNYFRLGIFIAGILLFLFAHRLVRNAVFYYGSGCSFGLLASLLIIVFIFYRMAPKKLIGLPILIGGWSFSVYILHFVWKNFTAIALQYQTYLAAYFVTVMAISFAVCYKRGPPTDSRSHDIAEWALQAISLLLIYVSSQVPEVAIGIIAILLAYQLARPWLWWIVYAFACAVAFIWRKLFRPTPTRRLLTMQEYEQEGRDVTKRELERFARFVDGKEGHVLEEEEESYEEDSGRMMDEGDDEEEEEEDSSSLERRYPTNRYHEEDDEGEWEEEVVIRRTPRRRFDSYSTPRESSFKNFYAVPKDRSRRFENPSPSRSSYYQNSSQQRYSSHRPSSSSPSRRYVSLADRDTRNYDSSLFRRYTNRQEQTLLSQKRTAPSTSKEFLSSDSEPDLQALDDNPR
nr:Protein of unknown function DUF2215 domain containing protein [Haemonchus contortus]